MNFEQTLLKVTQEYQTLLKQKSPVHHHQIQHLLTTYLQAKKIQFHDHNGEVLIIAPGLSKYSERENIINPALLNYHAKNHTPHPPQENGICIIHWQYKIPRLAATSITHPLIERLALEFHPKFPLPKTGSWNNLEGKYFFQATLGKIDGEYLETHRGHYHLNSAPLAQNNHPRLDLNLSVNRRDIRSLRFKTELLGTGILTSFFKDVNYDGLEKLVD